LRAIGRKIRPIATLLFLAYVGVGPASASAAEPPSVESVRAEGVTATGATLHGSIDPKGLATTYRFEYLPEAAYLANLEAVPAGQGFEGATWAPLSGAGAVGAGMGPVPVNQHISGLTPSTPYRYRLRAAHSGEATFSVVRPFGTEAPTNAFELLDGRGWEMVSPLEKAGGAVQPPGMIAGGGVFQAAASGGELTYSSGDSFGIGAQGAPAGSQYVAARGAGGWTSSNITTPALSGSYGDEPDGVPYQLFSSDLSSALLSNGERCRGDASGECPVANPPIAGSGAPAGYRNYYQRMSSGAFRALLTAAGLSHTSLGPEGFEMRLVAATPDLARVVLSSCAALAANAVEVAAAGGCNSADQNLYEWSGGSLSLINLLPGELTGTPGATVAAASGAVSADGSRVYFSIGSTVYLREGAVTKVVLESAEPSAFQVASTDGGVAYLVDAGVLYRYDAAPGTLTAMTAGPGVEGVLGISSDGSVVYYAESAAVFLRQGVAVTEVASSAAPGDWPPATGTARVSADGTRLLFLSKAELTGFPNEGQMEVFLYGPSPGGQMLTCVSCDPTGERPAGPSSIPGAIANGRGTQALDVYTPRVMSADGYRVFFDSADDLVPQDTNSATDVYEWEADGSGTCGRPGGCVQLISSGKGSEPAYFLDADADGGEAFFLTAESLYPPDPGSYDVYDARVGGGFAVSEQPIPCIGDACQVLPGAPEDPTPGTLVPNSGNPPLRIAGEKSAAKKKRKHRKKKHHKHAAKSKRTRPGKARGGR
jgi:hypothetical protein